MKQPKNGGMPATNREHVTAVASDLFLMRGVAQTSMDDVVRESGVAKSNIYYHFKSKDDLLVAVAEHRIKAFEEMARQLLQGGDRPVPEVLAQLMDHLTDELTGRNCVGGCPFLSLIMETAGREERVRHRISRFFQSMAETLEQLLVQGMLRGEIRRDIPPQQAAGLMVSTLEGSILLATAQGNAELVRERGLLLLGLLRS